MAKPEDVESTHDQNTKLTTWTRRGKGGAPDLVVSYLPSRHTDARRRQEADLARHLEERTPKR